MLQIDDAGWGCLVGVWWSVATACRLIPRPALLQQGGEFVSGVIAPATFRTTNAEEPIADARWRYLDAVAQVASIV